MILSKKTCIFVVSPGRSGTEYLARLFKCCRSTISVHEPLPLCIGRAFRLYDEQDEPNALQVQVDEKVELIQAHLELCDCYVETSNMFAKSFGFLIVPLLLKKGCKVVILCLHRDVSKIAASSLRIGCIPPSSLGRNWLITPCTLNPINPCPRYLPFLSARKEYGMVCRLYFLFRRYTSRVDIVWRLAESLFNIYWFKLLKWQAEEVYCRGGEILSRNPFARRYDASLTDLNNLDFVLSLFQELGLQVDAEKLKTVIARPVNLKR